MGGTTRTRRFRPVTRDENAYFLLKKKVGKENFNPSFLFQESVSLIWFSLSSNYAGFRFNKIIVLPFSLLKKFHNFLCFPLLLALHTLVTLFSFQGAVLT